MRKLEEAVDAVVRTGARAADAAKGCVLHGHVQDAVVEGDTARVGAVEDGALLGSRRGEAVEGERVVVGGCVGNGLVEGGVEDGQDGPEELLGQQRVVRRYIVHDCGRKVARLRVAVAAVDDLARRLGQEVVEAVVVTVVDDARDIVGLLGGAAIEELVKVLGEGLEEGGLDLGVDKDVVDADAYLARVEKLGAGDAPGGEVDVGVGGDNGRAAAAELEGDGGQVGGSAGVDDFADGGGAGEEDVIKLVAEEVVHLLWAGGDDADGSLVEVAGHDAGDEILGGRGQLAGLEDGGTSGGEGGDEGLKELHEGVVPCGDDEGDALGLAADAGAAEQVERVGAAGSLLGVPGLDVIEGLEDGGLDSGDVNGEGLLAMLVEVLLEGGDNGLLVVLEHPPGLAELDDAPF